MSSVIYISGEEPYLIREEVKKIVSEYDEMFNVKKMAGKVSAEMLKREFDYYPLMAEKRLIIANEVEEDDDLVNAIGSIPNYIVLLILGALDKRKKLFKAIKKMSAVKEIPKLKEYELRKWIKKQVESDDIVQLLIERLGIDSMDAIQKEIDKLLCIGKPIPYELAEKSVTRSVESDAFKLVGLASEGLRKDAYILIKEMYGRGDYLPLVVNLLNRNFAILKMLKCKSEAEVASEAGIHPYSLKLLYPLSKKMSEAKLEFLLLSTQEADFEMKNGEDHRFVLEKLIGVI